MKTNLAERLVKALSTKDGAKKVDLARACKVSRATVTDWLNGDIKELKAEKLIKASKFLGVRPEWLLWDEAPMRREQLTSEESELLFLWRKMDRHQREATMGVASLGRMLSNPVDPHLPPAPTLPQRQRRPRPG